jgi:16S rRNA (guanine966-N2)-methyltransferase
MRITGGTHGGRILKSPKDRTIRPTSDKVRLAMFNMLNARGLVQDSVVLDAFCGTGALGLEALSQGALCCIFMDKNRQSLDLAKDNFAALKMDAQHYFILKDATKPAPKPDNIPPANLIFFDPPYNQGLVHQSLESFINQGWIADDAVVLVETETGFDTGVLRPFGCDILFTRDYGDTRITMADRLAKV